METNKFLINPAEVAATEMMPSENGQVSHEFINQAKDGVQIVRQSADPMEEFQEKWKAASSITLEEQASSAESKEKSKAKDRRNENRESCGRKKHSAKERKARNRAKRTAQQNAERILISRMQKNGTGNVVVVQSSPNAMVSVLSKITFPSPTELTPTEPTPSPIKRRLRRRRRQESRAYDAETSTCQAANQPEPSATDDGMKWYEDLGFVALVCIGTLWLITNMRKN